MLVTSVNLGAYSAYASEDFLDRMKPSKGIPSKKNKDMAQLGLPTTFGGKKTRRRKKKSSRKGQRAGKVTRGRRREGNEPEKYWMQRYRYFWRFDEGIKLDEELWFSVTPESIAEHVAERCRCDVIVDAFAGAGGNAIQFAYTCERVIAIDIDPSKLECARHNASIYGVEDRIEFILGDCIDVLRSLAENGTAIDCVFLAPPWGGPGYVASEAFDVRSIQLPRGAHAAVDGIDLLRLARQVSSNVAYMLPKNINAAQYTSLATDMFPSCEIEQHCITPGKVKTCAAYHSEIFEQPACDK